MSPTPDTQTCPDCYGNGEFVWGSYSRTCSTCWGEGIVAVEVAEDEGDEPTPDPLPDDWQAFRGMTVRDRNGDRMVWRENGIRTGYYPAGTVAA